MLFPLPTVEQEGAFLFLTTYKVSALIWKTARKNTIKISFSTMLLLKLKCTRCWTFVNFCNKH
jgi:hypothetical protein